MLCLSSSRHLLWYKLTQCSWSPPGRKGFVRWGFALLWPFPSIPFPGDRTGVTSVPHTLSLSLYPSLYHRDGCRSTDQSKGSLWTTFKSLWRPQNRRWTLHMLSMTKYVCGQYNWSPSTSTVGFQQWQSSHFKQNIRILHRVLWSGIYHSNLLTISNIKIFLKSRTALTPFIN